MMSNKVRVVVPDGISIRDYYFNHVVGVSNSRLSGIQRWLAGNTEFQFPEHAARMGNLVDAILTQPDQIDFSAPREEVVRALKMAKTASTNPLVRIMLEKGDGQAIFTREITIRMNDYPKDIRFKSMLDVCLEKHRLGGDLKTTAATTYKDFVAAIHRFNYYRQGALYMEVADLDTFVFIGLPKTRNDVFVHIMTRDSVEFQKAWEEIHALAWYDDLMLAA